MNDETVRFIETSIFTKRLVRLVDDESYRQLQNELAENPEKGQPVQQTGGLRKVRMAARGKGKSGGAHVIYLYLAMHGVIYMVYVYDKGEAEDLTGAQKRELRAIAEAIKQEYRHEE